MGNSITVGPFGDPELKAQRERIREEHLLKREERTRWGKSRWECFFYYEGRSDSSSGFAETEAEAVLSAAHRALIAEVV